MSAFIVMDIVREAAKYPNTIHFEIGQPDFPPCENVKTALKNAVEKNCFSYTESLGLPALREKICQYYDRTYAVKITPDRVLLTPGTSGAFLVAYALTLASGDKLGLTDPSYPCYKNFAYMMDIMPEFIPVDYHDHYQLKTEQLKDRNIKALQISSPANPTGNIYTSERLKALNEYCIANIDFISAPTLSQYAALEAFDDEYLAQTKQLFRQRRDFLYNELKQLVTIEFKPQGAFYLWADVSEYTNDSYEFAKKMLHEIQVAATPGIDFGTNGTTHYLRFAYTRDIEHLREGVERMKVWLAGQK